VIVDPVCKMLVYEEKAAATSDHNGQTYYFCSPRCKKDFDKDPGGYIGRECNDSSGHCGACGH
jgi:YHS domain-containing protein